MAAHRRVYDSRHLQADGQEPGSAPEPSVIGYGLPLSFYSGLQVVSKVFYDSVAQHSMVQVSSNRSFECACVA